MEDCALSPFNWLLGLNRLHQIAANPCTGGSYNGVEKTHANAICLSESAPGYFTGRLPNVGYNRNNQVKNHIPDLESKQTTDA